MPPRKRKLSVVDAGTETTKAAHSRSPSPKRTTGGNTKGDRAWLAEVADEIRTVGKDDAPEGFLYDVELQWTRHQEDLNPDFWLEGDFGFRNGRRCTGPAYVRDDRGGYVIDVEWNRLRRPCLAPPAKGADVCHRHGAQTGHVKRAAMQRLAEASEVAALRLITLTGMQDEAAAVIAHKDRIAAISQLLDRAGIKHNAEIEDPSKEPGYKKVLGKLFGGDDDE